MRLIDADEAEKYLYEHLDDLHMIAAQNAIDEMPTIDAHPVKRWSWIESEPDEDDRKIGIEFSIKCSRCYDENSHLDFNENHEITGKTFWKSRFCPNCGAKMDGDDAK